MNWQALLTPEIQSFITAHNNDDVRDLALKKPPSIEWPYALILDQIKARQKAVLKCPHMLNYPEIILPAANLIEQASSQACANYKASLVKGDSFADLTAGSGMDSMALAKTYKGQCFAVERDKDSAGILMHNLERMSLLNIRVIHADSEEFINSMPSVDTILIDPQRREGQKRGIFALEDCSPNIIELLPILKNKSRTILLKTSPVLDIRKAIDQLDCVSAVHIVQHKKECKELVFVLTPTHSIEAHNIPLTAVTIDNHGQIMHSFSYTHVEERITETEFSKPLKYLYEPDPAYQKSGAFKLLGARFGLKKLHPNTHLYTSDMAIEDYPGRIFETINQCQPNKKALKAILPDMKAGISVRNFNMRPEELRKKLGLGESDLYTLFACEFISQQKMLILCKKYKKIE